MCRGSQLLFPVDGMAVAPYSAGSRKQYAVLNLFNHNNL